MRENCIISYEAQGVVEGGIRNVVRGIIVIAWLRKKGGTYVPGIALHQPPPSRPTQTWVRCIAELRTEVWRRMGETRVGKQRRFSDAGQVKTIVGFSSTKFSTIKRRGFKLQMTFEIKMLKGQIIRKIVDWHAIQRLKTKGNCITLLRFVDPIVEMCSDFILFLDFRTKVQITYTMKRT